MIDYLIEIIFKSIPNEIIGNLLKDLTKDGKAILNYHANTELGNIDWTSSDLINEIFKKHSDFGLFRPCCISSASQASNAFEMIFSYRLAA